MPSYSKIVALAAVAAPSLVSAHGYVSGVVSNGEWHSGTSPEWTYQSSKPATAGWYANNQDNGFVEPNSYGDADIICHKGATPGQGSIPVTAGKSIDIQWNTWPDSHHGPVITYLASCGGDCSSVTKANLKFFKIDAGGLNDGSAAPGSWASDDLLANNVTSTVTIPADIADGNYVLRHEIIALHSAGQENGAQNYPQCLNVEVSGGGSATPEGTAGTALYKSDDAGILIDIYQSLSSYEIPGPALYGSSSNSSKVKRTPVQFRA
ncbi:glycoside hydrolase family 61 protein [Pseudocercospora fijiensis CIRAD86]|uniref:Glycoside hydrolase family 61 protein n=1 Tax=Pseudocercospora fijiensis (strain CIRAD86) TaxID=383855 RepID=M3BB25_PSEFD|nr:glycoside hydrolase family 61 protein [Pseudocercospora fijiensis CIRAD86]EME86418.1 glycoside hydrolase family 61 protein [Pseudocercospora fijiensis CIRAD86]